MFKILKWKKLWIEQIANKSAWEQTNGENELTYLRIRDGIFFFSGWFPVHVLEDPDDEAVDSLLDVWRGVEPFATCSIQAGIHSSSTPSQPFAMEFQGQFPRDMGFCTAQMKVGRLGGGGLMRVHSGLNGKRSERRERLHCPSHIQKTIFIISFLQHLKMKSSREEKYHVLYQKVIRFYLFFVSSTCSHVFNLKYNWFIIKNQQDGPKCW